MLQTTALPTHHADLVTDIAYDFYGERLATASADQRIKVWRKKDSSKGAGGGGWELEDEWKAHEAPILSIAWSHPEFGSLLVSSSYDRSVRIWEETDQPNTLNLGLFASGSGSGPGTGMGGQPESYTNGAAQTPGIGQSQMQGQQQQQQSQQRVQKWLERAHLTDARGSVRQVGWAPNAFGVKVASISTDSYLRIYSSLSPLLNDWQLNDAIHLPTLTLPSRSAADAPPVTNPANGASSSYGSGAFGSFGNTNSSALGGQAGSGSAQGQAKSAAEYNPGRGNEALGGWGLSWCKEKWWGQVIAVTSGHAGVVKVINLSTPMPTALLILEPPPPSKSGSSSSGTTSTAAHGPGAQAITSLSWAPNGGRSYHSIATGSRDGTVRVWKVYAPEPEEEDQRWRAEVSGEWGTGDATVGKVEWNITGSMLSVSSEDGQVKLYKATFAGKWALMGSFSAEAPNPPDGGNDDSRMQD